MKSDSAFAKLLAQFGANVEASSTSAIAAEFAEFRAAADKEKAELLGAVEKSLIAAQEAESTIAKLTSDLEAANAKLAAVEASIAAKATEARRARISAAIGDSKVDAVMAATEGMEDAKFDAILAAMAGSIDAEASSKMFRDNGADVKSTAPVVEESKEMKILREKYGVKA